MRPGDRPYIEFWRVLNKGISPRTERVGKDGKVERPAHPGEFWEVWRKSLIDHKPPYAPYSWATKDWVIGKINADRMPIDYGNLDKLPLNYPAAWRNIIEECISAVAGLVHANRELVKLRKEKEELEGERQAAAQLREPSERNREDAERLQATSGATGETADSASGGNLRKRERSGSRQETSVVNG